MKKETLKEIVFDLIEKGKCTDQEVINRYGKLPKFSSVENYIGQYKRMKFYTNEKEVSI